jgi:hypothetical protein
LSSVSIHSVLPLRGEPQMLSSFRLSFKQGPLC